MSPHERATQLAVYQEHDPLRRALGRDAGDHVRKRNHEPLFDAAGQRVRACEKANVD